MFFRVDFQSPGDRGRCGVVHASRLFRVNTVILDNRQLRGEVHLEGAGKAEGGGEGEVHVAARKDLGNVCAGDLHALGERRLVKAKLLHASDYHPQEPRT